MFAQLGHFDVSTMKHTVFNMTVNGYGREIIYIEKKLCRLHKYRTEENQNCIHLQICIAEIAHGPKAYLGWEFVERKSAKLNQTPWMWSSRNVCHI